MGRQKCTIKWKDKSVHLNCICIFRWKDKSVRLNGKTKVVYVKWQDKSVRLNGKTKVYV